MAETIKVVETGSDSGDKKIIYFIWPLENVKEDLITQGGLEENLFELPFIDEASRKCQGKYEIVNNYFTDHHTYLAVYNGTYKGVRFRMRWMKNEEVEKDFLVVTSEKPLPELISAFSKVLEYKPFAKYRFKDLNVDVLPFKDGLQFTVEWDKKNSDQRFKELEKDSRKKYLQKLTQSNSL